MATSRARRRVRREPMSWVDSAWLRMERPTNPMMITGVLMFAERMSLARLRQVIAQRFLAHARFRQMPVETATGMAWSEPDGFDLDWHVRAAALPPRRGASQKQALERYVSGLASSPLDRDRPLWQFHLVGHYAGGSALVARIHHCYADGVALVRVLLSLTDTSRDAPQAGAAGARPMRARGAARGDAGPLDRYLALGEQVVGQGMAVYRDPARAALLAKEAGELTGELMRLLLLPGEPATLLRGELGAIKRVAWTAPLEVDALKAVGRACNCTVNDVLMATATGALRDYMLERGDDLDGVTVRATVPVNLRPPGEAAGLGNEFGLVFLALPVGEANPVRRLQLVAAGMEALKGSRQALLTYGLLAALGMGPPAVQELATAFFSRKASAVATNVPGPQQPLYMGGCRLREMMFWVPQSGSVGIGISMLSYDGRAQFGLIADARLIPDPEAVIERFGPEFDKLLYLALMGDWDRALDGAAAEALMPTGS